MNVDEVLLAEPRGFCAGVEKAIKALAWMVKAFPAPVYCYHEIVHNQHVVQRFVDQGVIFVDDVADVPPGAPLMLSAHGSAPSVVDQARGEGRIVVDAVCPLVTKVHHELKVRARKGFTVLYVGHQGHEEAVGTMAVAPDASHLIESTADIDALEDRLWPLCEKVTRQARTAGIAGRVASLKLRAADFRLITRRRTLPVPTQSSRALFAVARDLLAAEARGGRYRLIGAGLSDFVDAADGLDLFAEAERRDRRGEKALDALRERFGRDAVMTGRALRSKD